jgi:hypothetical protein
MKNLRIKISEYGEQQLEALELPARVELELSDGSTVTVLHPWLWDDKTEAAVKKAAEESDEPYNTRYAKAVLGTKEHARFIKGGGTSSMIALAVATMKNGSIIKADEGSDPKDPSSKDS